MPLASFDKIVQGLHCLLNGYWDMPRDAVRMAVNNQLIDVIETQALQAAIYTLYDVFTGQSILDSKCTRL